MHYNHLHKQTDEEEDQYKWEASQREGEAWQVMRLRDPYAEHLEPTLEFCMKVQRRPALTVQKLDADASIRVVPPSFRSLLGLEAFSIYSNRCLGVYEAVRLNGYVWDCLVGDYP